MDESSVSGTWEEVWALGLAWACSSFFRSNETSKIQIKFSLKIPENSHSYMVLYMT